jgi:hypothetical protein
VSVETALSGDQGIYSLASIAPSHAGIFLVYGGRVLCLCLTKTTHLFGVLMVPPSLPPTGVAMGVMARLPSLGPEGAEPLSKKACPSSFLPVSSWYVHGVVLRFIPLPFLLFLF